MYIKFILLYDIIAIENMWYNMMSEFHVVITEDIFVSEWYRCLSWMWVPMILKSYHLV